MRILREVIELFSRTVVIALQKGGGLRVGLRLLPPGIEIGAAILSGGCVDVGLVTVRGREVQNVLESIRYHAPHRGAVHPAVSGMGSENYVAMPLLASEQDR